jgi:hypothetical protein
VLPNDLGDVLGREDARRRDRGRLGRPLLGLSVLPAGGNDRPLYLDLGLAAVLVFVGAKMTLADIHQIPAHVSLAVIVVLLAAAVAASELEVGPGRLGRKISPSAAVGPRLSRFGPQPTHPLSVSPSG